jgi:hypothetical protein
MRAHTHTHAHTHARTHTHTHTHTHAVDARSALPGTIRTMARTMHAAYVVCDAVVSVRSAASLHELYYWREMRWKDAY